MSLAVGEAAGQERRTTPGSSPAASPSRARLGSCAPWPGGSCGLSLKTHHKIEREVRQGP